MAFDACSICGKYDFLDRHRCPPAWEVVIAEGDDHYPGDDDPRLVYGRDPEDAAEEWAFWLVAAAVIIRFPMENR